PQVERFNRTIQEEFVALGNNHISIKKFNQRMTKWLIHYNFERPHQSLGYLPPLEWVVKYYPKVLPMYPVHTNIRFLQFFVLKSSRSEIEIRAANFSPLAFGSGGILAFARTSF
ncbi:MAG: integrase core domain-containing protein, partial [Patescibacteria group bacterium]